MLFLENNTTPTTTTTSLKLNLNENNMENKIKVSESKDETDFVKQKLEINLESTQNHKRGSLLSEIDPKAACVAAKSISTLEKLQIFNFPLRKKSDPNPQTKEKPKFVKSASIARLFGNNYSTKKNESIQLISNKVQQERFQQNSQCENVIDEIKIKDFTESPDRDISVKAIKTLSRGIGRLLRRHTHSIDISEPDPEFKVAYLGNVLTGWAKGDGYIEKPLSTLWRNYTQNTKPDVMMKIRVCSSGLKATTKQHGLTEYWSHRITFCSAPKNYPRVFCWVYRHEGRKLKHEMRCHAVLCTKESIAKEIGNKLQENITRALQEFKRDKISRQNARLSLVNSVYDNPTIPRRKILLSIGGSNYRPPLERSKSAPKLGAIEEAIGEEEEDNENNENNDDNCSKEDNLYPSITLGRRRCRRGNSIRKSNFIKRNSMRRKSNKFMDKINNNQNESESLVLSNQNSVESPTIEDDYNDLLLKNNFDSSEPLLEGEIMSYFDMKLKPKSLINLNQPSSQDSSNSDSSNNQCEFKSKSLDNLDNYLNSDDDDNDDNINEMKDHKEIAFFNQEDILEILRSHDCHGNGVNYAGHNLNHFNNGNEYNLTPGAASECDDDNKNLDSQPTSILCMDSDEGSISSGCETSSTVTTTNDDIKSILNETHNTVITSQLNSTSSSTNLQDDDEIVLLEPVGEKNSINSLNSSSLTTTPNKKRVEFHCSTKFIECTNKNGFSLAEKLNGHRIRHDSDSEFSDESGYVEEQENRNRINGKFKPGIV